MIKRCAHQQMCLYQIVCTICLTWRKGESYELSPSGNKSYIPYLPQMFSCKYMSEQAVLRESPGSRLLGESREAEQLGHNQQEEQTYSQPYTATLLPKCVPTWGVLKMEILADLPHQNLQGRDPGNGFFFS
jgi:hypothetical protein